MHVITRKRLNEFAARYPETRNAMTEAEYDLLVELLDRLIDQVGEDESHPLASMMDVIGVLIENYEIEHIPKLT